MPFIVTGNGAVMITVAPGSDWVSYIVMRGGALLGGTASRDVSVATAGATVDDVSEVNAEGVIGCALVSNRIGVSCMRGFTAVVYCWPVPLLSAVKSPRDDSISGTGCFCALPVT